MIKGVVFDLDGTLIDSNKYLAESWILTFKKLGYNITYEFYLDELRGLSARDIIKKVTRIEDEHKIKSIISMRKEIFVNFIDKIKVFPEVPSVLTKLSLMGIKMAIASSLSLDLMQSLRRLLNINQIEVWISSDMVKEGKPKPDVFIEAMRRLLINPSECIIVGDSKNDILPAKQIGTKAVLIEREKLKEK
jgi:haloacid dehalogenase superfamily, subfamily IA, variant 3 with third motif having DD or ED/haloacid dehalogenase superfamily, subfamily IA, variant 1 with third motif having Dx(3-4)D or Dx(3-4)E